MSTYQSTKSSKWGISFGGDPLGCYKRGKQQPIKVCVRELLQTFTARVAILKLEQSLLLSLKTSELTSKITSNPRYLKDNQLPHTSLVVTKHSPPLWGPQVAALAQQHSSLGPLAFTSDNRYYSCRVWKAWGHCEWRGEGHTSKANSMSSPCINMTASILQGQRVTGGPSWCRSA